MRRGPIGVLEIGAIPATADLVEHCEVADHELHEAGQVVGVPPAVQVRLAEPRAALGDHLTPHGRRVQPDRHVEIGRLPVDRPCAVVFDHGEPAVVELGEQATEQRAGRLVRGRRCARERTDLDRPDRVVGVGRVSCAEHGALLGRLMTTRFGTGPRRMTGRVPAERCALGA